MNELRNDLSDLTISVCMATFNGGRYIERQLESILPQLKRGDELLVSDDGSTDNTLSVLKKFEKDLRVVNVLKVGGVVKNFEKVLSYSTNQIIVLCDQDDVWLPGRLDKIRKKLVSTDFLFMNGHVVDELLVDSGVDVLGYVGFRGGFVNTFMATKYVGCCLAFRRSILSIALPFPRNIKWHDWYISLIAELLYRCEVDVDKTILFRRHQSNASTTGSVSNSSFVEKAVYRFWIFLAVLSALKRFVKLKIKGCF